MSYKDSIMNQNYKKISLLSEKNTDRRYSGYLEKILILCLLTGILLALRDLEYSKGCLAAAETTGILVLILQHVMSGSEKRSERLRLVLYIISAGCFIVGLTFIIQGFLYSADIFLQLWNLRFGTEFQKLAVGSGAGIGSLFLWGLAGVVLVSWFDGQMRNKSFYGIFLGCIPSLAFGYILGVSSMWAAGVLLFAGMLVIFSYYSAPERRFGSGDIICSVILIALAAAMIISVGGYHQLVSIERWKRQAAEEFDKFRYGSDTLPQGNLRKASGLLKGNKETLEITVEQPEELYLRGFVGGTYGGNYWTELASPAYQDEYAGMLTWLDKNEFSPTAQYEKYDELTSRNNGTSQSSVKISVKNTGAYRKYVYLPEQVVSWNKSGTKSRKDWNVLSTAFFGASSYSFQVMPEAPSAETFYPAEWMENATEKNQISYLKAESVYHSFAEDNYKTVDAELKPVLTEFFYGDEEIDKTDFSQVTTVIRQKLRMNLEYTENPETVPSGEDFIRWFLTDYKKGNAVSFASAAVMAYRVSGYPARYVEGYHLSETEAQEMKDTGSKKITLTSSDAHAWVEVYVAGAGWLPVEVVPGFYVETYSDKIVQGRPAYKISSSSDDGLSTKDENTSGTRGKSGSEKKRKTKPDILKYMPSVVLLFLYLFPGIYLIFELQRAVRLKLCRKRRQEAGTTEEKLENYIIEYEHLMGLAGITGDYTQPLQLWEEIAEKLPMISEGEYKRVVMLLQKARFGGQELEVYEYRTLEGFRKLLCNGVYEGKNRFRKMILRYVYAVPKYDEV